MSGAQGKIFGDLIGRSGAKAILRSALRGGQVDVLLNGEPGSGKSVALVNIEESVPGARKLDASAASAAKLRDILAMDPPILLLDELDDANRGVYNALSEPMEDRRVTKAVNGNEIDVEIRTQFFAASNSIDALPEHIQDRFQTVHFPEYSEDEFREVCEGLLPRIIDWIEEPETGRAVADAVLSELGSRDVRNARDVARLSGSPERIGSIARALNDPEADVQSEPLTVDEISVLHDNTDSDGASNAHTEIVNAMLEDMSPEEIKETLRKCQKILAAVEEEEIDLSQLGGEIDGDGVEPDPEEGDVELDYDSVDFLIQSFMMAQFEPDDEDEILKTIEDGLTIHFKDEDFDTVHRIMADLWDHEGDLDNFLFYTDDSNLEDFDHQKSYDLRRYSESPEAPFEVTRFEPSELAERVEESDVTDFVIESWGEPLA